MSPAMEQNRNPDPTTGGKSTGKRSGRFSRFLLVDIVGYVLTGLMFEFARRFEFIEIELLGLLAIFGTFLTAHVLATIAGIFPASVDFVQLRLGLAAFCRTILPLLALLLMEHYLIAVLHRQNMLVILSFYFLSLGLGLWSASVDAK